MIPRNTAPGTEIVALDDITVHDTPPGVVKHSLRAISKGETLHLARWEDCECHDCGERMITLTEIDPLVYASENIISSVAAWCPRYFALPIKLPQSLRRFECEGVDKIEVLEDA